MDKKGTKGGAFALLGDKRCLWIVERLSGGAKNVRELNGGAPGVGSRTLYRALLRLARAGILSREVLPTSPPRVVYELTPLGRSLAEPVAALARWIRANAAQIETARNDRAFAPGDRRPAPLQKESGRPAFRRSARFLSDAAY